MPKTKKLPARSKVKPDDTWDLASLFKNDDEWEKAFTAWEKQIPQVRKVPRHARRRPGRARQVPRVRQRLRSRRRAARHVRPSENGRGHGRQPLPADAAAATSTPPRSPPKRPASSGRKFSSLPDKKLKEYVDAEAAAAVQAAARTAHPLQAAHARPRRRKAAGDAERNGRRGRPRLPPAHRRRSQVRHVQEREGRIGRAVARDRSRASCARRAATSASKAFHQYYEQFQAPRKLARRRVLQLGAEGRVLRQGPRLPERPRGVAVSRQRAGRGVRQSHRRRPRQAAGGLSSTSSCAARRCSCATFIITTPTCRSSASSIRGTRGSRPSTSSSTSLEPLGDEYCRVLDDGLDRPLVRPLPEPGQAQRRVQLAARTTAGRTS